MSLISTFEPQQLFLSSTVSVGDKSVQEIQMRRVSDSLRMQVEPNSDKLTLFYDWLERFHLFLSRKKTISGGEIFDWDIKKEDNLKEEVIISDF